MIFIRADVMNIGRVDPGVVYAHRHHDGTPYWARTITYWSPDGDCRQMVWQSDVEGGLYLPGDPPVVDAAPIIGRVGSIAEEFGGSPDPAIRDYLGVGDPLPEGMPF